MGRIDSELNTIKTHRYGEEVRMAIHDALDKLEKTSGGSSNKAFKNVAININTNGVVTAKHMTLEEEIKYSKVNESYWGEIDKTTDKSYKSSKRLSNLIQEGTFDPSNYSTLDLTCCPWGIGYSNAGSVGGSFLMRSGENLDERDPGYLSRLEIISYGKHNNPFSISINTISNATTRVPPKHRLTGMCEGASNGDVISLANYDNGIPIPRGTSGNSSQYKPLLYFEYNNIRIAITTIHMWNRKKRSWTVYRNFLEFEPEEGYDYKDYYVYKIYFSIYFRGKTGNLTWSGPYGIIMPLGLCEHNAVLDNSYFGAPTDVLPVPVWNMIGDGGDMFTNDFQPITTTLGIPVAITSSMSYAGAGMRCWGRYSNAEHEYEIKNKLYSEDNLKYKCTPICQYSGSEGTAELEIGSHLPGSTSSSVNLSVPIIYEFEDYDQNDPNINVNDIKNRWIEMINHEVAFFGLPFQWGTESFGKLGDASVYIPIFDEHLITTGDYKNGLDSLTLPNAKWHNVFDNSMPAYDPFYQPEEVNG